MLCRGKEKGNEPGWTPAIRQRQPRRRKNSCSILEAFDRVEQLTGKKMTYEYIDKNREGDHICYISNLTGFKSHYPKWEISKSLDDIFREISEAWKARLAA
jgi:CDP-paratose 2-epimerase